MSDEQETEEVVETTESNENAASRTVIGPLGTIEHIVSARLSKDWNDELTDEHCIQKDGQALPTLAGLQKLARIAGWCGSETRLSHVEAGQTGVFQAIVQVFFDDGASFTGCADCNKGNTDKKFLVYPTAVAESRAEARALKKALGIFRLTAEEIGFGNDAGFSSNPATPKSVATGNVEKAVVMAIESALNRRTLDFLTVAQELLETERCDELSSISDLTGEEGAIVLAFLNTKKPDAKIEQTRESRKEALKKTIEKGK